MGDIENHSRHNGSCGLAECTIAKERDDVSQQRPTRYRWTIEIEVAAEWVADGIDLTSERMQRIMCERAFPYLKASEITCRTIAAPNPEDIAREQGYSSADERARDKSHK